MVLRGGSLPKLFTEAKYLLCATSEMFPFFKTLFAADIKAEIYESAYRRSLALAVHQKALHGTTRHSVTTKRYNDNSVESVQSIIGQIAAVPGLLG